MRLAPAGTGVEARRLAAGGWYGLALVAITAVGLALRVAGLWPPVQGVVQAPYDDEGVYVMAAQLLWQGSLPYRDYFFAHPPLGPLLIAPALALNFTPWGSALSFGSARLLVALMGAAAVPLVGLAAGRVWGMPGGVIAAGWLAVDPASVANSRHVLLDVPMTTLAAAALLAATSAGRRAGVLSGVLAGLATVVKIQAALLIVALALAPVLRRQWRHAAAVAAGALGAALAALPIILMAGADPFVRQVGLFQLARPADGLATTAERLAALLAPAGLATGLIAAALGLVVAGMTGVARRQDGWQPAALWVAMGLIGFLVSRSYYPHYASQLAPGLALLAGGLGTALGGAPVRRAVRAVAAAGAVACVGVAAWQTAPIVAPRPDAMFATVARYVADAVPPTGAVLATDAQFNVLASRPLPRAADGFLVDSYGVLTYTGLGLDQGSLSDAVVLTLSPRPATTVDEVIWRPAAQALLRDHLGAAGLVVIHEVGRRRLTPETQAWLADRFSLAESTRRYEIYRRGP
jgi:hypothetical protein